MPGLFTSIRSKRPKSNKFSLSHERKFSFKMGDLVPIMVQDIVPGDNFRVSSEVLLRFAPMLAPVMHRVNVFTHYFFVPNRLLWSEWEDFITGGREGLSNPATPYFLIDDVDTVAKGSLSDYLGLPISVPIFPPAGNPFPISVLPHRAYLEIYNQYYRDQNLSSEVVYAKTGGLVLDYAAVLNVLRKRAWEKDYFTSALPWAQRGGSVDIPLSDDPAIVTTFNDTVSLGNPSAGNALFTGTQAMSTAGSGNPLHVGPDGHGVNINDLRRSMRLQEWLEKNARGGARYVEQILSHFGVKSSDARLQRPEYLGGGKQPVVISEVLSTFQDATGEPQGNMAGHAVSVGNSNGFRKRFEEHGYVIGLMSVLPKTAYQQGVPRHFLRQDRFDYYWPEFANIGEQEIKVGELFHNPEAATPESSQVFGYQSRYSEYKFCASSVHGEFRDTLDFWHMGRKFVSVPSLNQSFVESDPTTRIFAVTQNEHMYCQLYNRVDAMRPMPYFGTPVL